VQHCAVSANGNHEIHRSTARKHLVTAQTTRRSPHNSFKRRRTSNQNTHLQRIVANFFCHSTLDVDAASSSRLEKADQLFQILCADGGLLDNENVSWRALEHDGQQCRVLKVTKRAGFASRRLRNKYNARAFCAASPALTQHTARLTLEFKAKGGAVRAQCVYAFGAQYCVSSACESVPTRLDRCEHK
jgi:hypothetical protein